MLIGLRASRVWGRSLRLREVIVVGGGLAGLTATIEVPGRVFRLQFRWFRV